MGNIHPRNKLEVGRRAALSLLALMSDDTHTRSTGAVFESCAASGAGVFNVTFAQGPLVLANGKPDSLTVSHADGFEVQLANGTWLPIGITAHDGRQLQLQLQQAGRSSAASTGSKRTGELFLGLRYAWRDHACCPRFYSADPVWTNWAVKDRAHPQMNGACPPKNCSVYTAASGLPATPFTVALGARGADGQQRCAQFVTQV
jgi:hypothetical protein